MSTPDETPQQIEVTDFGKMPDGTPVRLFTLRSATLTASFTDYGARIVSLYTPDRKGRLGGVVLGYDALPLYFAR